MTVADAPQSELELVAAAIKALSSRLPPTWQLVPLDVDGVASYGPDGEAVLHWSQGKTWIVFEAKRIVTSRDISSIQAQLAGFTKSRPGSLGVLVARYLSPPVRDRLAEAGLSYIDATGNMRVASESPALFISDRGADRDPWRGPGRPRGGLKGEPAAKVVRALIDVGGGWSISKLLHDTGVSTGAAYRVLAFLEEEGLVQRSDKQFRVPDWVRLLRRWTRDYEFVKTNRTSRWLAPRGLPALLARVRDTDLQYAVTGTFAAAEWAPYAPAKSAMIFTPDAQRAAEEWGLRSVDAGANVILAEPESDVAYVRSRIGSESGYTIAAPAQVAADLMTGPGRGPSEAEELINWMASNEQSWRH